MLDGQATNVKHLSPKTPRCRAQTQAFAEGKKRFTFTLFTPRPNAINTHLDYAVITYLIDIPPQCSGIRAFFEKAKGLFLASILKIDNAEKLRASRDLPGEKRNIRPFPRPLMKRKLSRVRRPLHL